MDSNLQYQERWASEKDVEEPEVAEWASGWNFLASWDCPLTGKTVLEATRDDIWSIPDPRAFPVGGGSEKYGGHQPELI